MPPGLGAVGLCGACRLLQPSGRERCRACGGEVVGLTGDAALPLREVIPAHLALADTAFDHEGTGGKVARGLSLPILWAGCLVVFGLTLGITVAPWVGIAAGTLTSAGATWAWIRPRWRRKPSVVTERLAARAVESGDLRDGRGTWRGLVRGSGPSVTPFLGGLPAVLAHVMLVRKGKLVLRALRGGELQVVTAAGDQRVTAVDNILLVGPRGAKRRRNADPQLQQELGLAWKLEGVAEEVAVREGDEVEVFGDLSMVPSTEADYRSGSEVAVANESRRPVLLRVLRCAPTKRA